nr:hypothetical protein [Marinitoga lauensis]
MKRLIKYLNQYKWTLIISIIFAMASAIFAIIGPKILGKVTTKIFEGIMSKIMGGAGIDFVYISHIMFILLVYISSV